MEVSDVKRLSMGEQLPIYSTSKLSWLDVDEIDEIMVKPSAELIPDEYEHKDNKRGLVLVFHSKDDEENMKMLKSVLTHHNYDVPDTNIYEMSTKEFVLESLKKVAQENHEDKTCFILFFVGNAKNEKGDLFLPDEESDFNNCILVRDVWSLFTSDKCPSLRNKPKILIFQACKNLQKVQFYRTRVLNENLPNGAYDIPAEADMLLVYKKIEVPWARNHFIKQLCNNLHHYGHKDDMIGLVTHTDHQGEKRPLIISTLTRKFYVRLSDQRGHHYDIRENHDTVIEKLQDVNVKIKTMQEQESVFAAP